MSDPKLTAAICFANEGDEVEHTVRGLRETCGDDIHILLINDASNDGRDYETVADKYECRYLLNESQIGPAHSRHKGLQWSKTENVIFLDAHMRFYGEGWHNIVNDIIADDPNALYCTRSIPLKKGGLRSEAPVGLGASVKMEDGFGKWLEADWNVTQRGDADTSYIPCVLGGCYAVRRDFMLSFGGYQGLHRYGGEEPLISIKAWLSGGSCKVINTAEIGHIYRDSEGAPWVDTIKYYHFNKLATARIVMDEEGFAEACTRLKTEAHGGEAIKVFNSRRPFVEKARAVFRKAQQHPFDYFMDLNNAFRNGETIIP